MVYTHSLTIKPKQKYTYSHKANPAQSLVNGQQTSVLHHNSAVLYRKKPATHRKKLCSIAGFLRFAYDFSCRFICPNRSVFLL